jgi:hypothetical protein
MKRRSVKKTIPILLTAVLMAAPAAFLAADEKTEGRLTLSLSLGVGSKAALGSLIPLSGTADVPGVDVFLEPSNPDAALAFGYQISERFELQVEARAGRASIIDDVGIGFAGIPLGRMKVADATSWNLAGRAVYRLGRGRLVPYLAAGAGIMALDAGMLGSKTRPALDIGAGLSIRISKHLAAVLDLRDTVSFFNYFRDFKIGYIMIYTSRAQSIQHRLGARLGLGYVF